MSQLFRFTSAVRRDPTIEPWMQEHTGELGSIAQRWFEVMRDCGDDAAFAYVNVFRCCEPRDETES